MKVAVYSTHKFEKDILLHTAEGKHELIFLEPQLSLTTAALAEGCKAAVCIFVNDDGSKDVFQKLSAIGIKYVALRSAGFNHVDIKAANELGIRVARVPEYSPYAVAEHTIALMLALNRKLIKAHNRIRELNFSLEGLTGFDMHNKTVGIIGTGKIGKIVAEILHGFRCSIIACDIMPDNDWAKRYGVVYTGLDSLCG